METLLKEIILSFLIHFNGGALVLASFFVFFGKRYSVKKMLLFLSLFIAASSMGYLLELLLQHSGIGVLLKTLNSAIVLMFLSMIILKNKFTDTIIACFVSFFLVTGSEGFILLIQYYIGLTIDQVKASFQLTIAVNIFLTFIQFFILAAIYYSKITREKALSEGLNWRLNRAFFITVLIIFLLLGNSTTIIVSLKEGFFSFGNVFANLFLVILYLGFSGLNFISYTRYQNLYLELEQQSLHNKTAQQFLHEVKKFTDDFYSTLNRLKSYSEKEKWMEIENSLNSAVHHASSINLIQNLMDAKIQNPALLGLLGSKVEEALKTGVDLSLFVQENIVIPSSDDYALFDILGILIDNAIEAAKESQVRQVMFKVQELSQAIVFTVENSFKDRPDIHSIFKKGVSSKGKGRGNGLWYVKNRIDKIKHFHLNTFIQDGVFKQELIAQNFAQ